MGHQEDMVKTESKIIVIRDTQVILDRDVAGQTARKMNWWKNSTGSTHSSILQQCHML